MKKDEKLANVLGIYLLIALGATILLGIFVIKPIYDQTQTASAKLSTENGHIAALNQLASDTAALRVNYAAITAQRDQIINLLPVKSQEENLLVLISSIAQRNGVLLTTFSPQIGAGTASSSSSASGGAAGSVANITPYVVSMNITGSFGNLQNFLAQLEKSARFVDITSGDFSSGATSAGVLEQLKIQLSAYYQGASTASGVTQ